MMLVQWLQVWVEIQIDFYVVVEDSLRLTCFKHVWKNTVFWWNFDESECLSNESQRCNMRVLSETRTHTILSSSTTATTTAKHVNQFWYSWRSPMSGRGKNSINRTPDVLSVYIVQNNMVSNTSLHLFLCREKFLNILFGYEYHMHGQDVPVSLKIKRHGI